MKSLAPKQKDRKQIRIDIPIWAEILLMRLFGQPMAHIHGRHSIKTWKKILTRLTKSIEKAIKINVQSDGLHLRRLEKFTRQLTRACKEKDVGQPDLILPLVGIIFELLGGMPDYRDRARINRTGDYVLCHLRELQFKQNDYHKMRTILEASRQEPFCRYHNYDDLEEVYTSECNSTPAEFIMWYKQTYPRAYLQLF
jgi:hypothetical protein